VRPPGRLRWQRGQGTRAPVVTGAQLALEIGLQEALTDKDPVVIERLLDKLILLFGGKGRASYSQHLNQMIVDVVRKSAQEGGNSGPIVAGGGAFGAAMIGAALPALVGPPGQMLASTLLLVAGAVALGLSITLGWRRVRWLSVAKKADMLSGEHSSKILHDVTQETMARQRVGEEDEDEDEEPVGKRAKR
jgi:hypothetical protein